MANHLAARIFLSCEFRLVIKEVGYDAVADVMIKGICQKAIFNIFSQERVEQLKILVAMGNHPFKAIFLHVDQTSPWKILIQERYCHWWLDCFLCGGLGGDYCTRFYNRNESAEDIDGGQV
ncbi:hypothetical protein OUZ56_025017 [Daphnia magna]|uniref:Uncharacterized protein n=1 Tax=Daphnia magna TaxID=35525 RepID=A0ABQ9ZIL6_9CRUS|nr:hypothetical protein OUZ56_025017 [Daphnia magna]